MPRLADLLAESQTVEVAGVHVTFNPQALSVSKVEELSELDESTVNVGHVRSVLGEIITEWDLLDNDGNPLPPTADSLAEVPFGFLDLLATALITDLRPSRAEGNGRSQLSSTPASDSRQDSPTFPKSSESSSPPAGQESLPGSSPEPPSPGSTGSA
jgi:hypothetical protein